MIGDDRSADRNLNIEGAPRRVKKSVLANCGAPPGVPPPTRCPLEDVNEPTRPPARARSARNPCGRPVCRWPGSCDILSPAASANPRALTAP